MLILPEIPYFLFKFFFIEELDRFQLMYIPVYLVNSLKNIYYVTRYVYILLHMRYLQ